MMDPRVRIEHLWSQGWNAETADEQHAYDAQLVAILADHPELDAWFLDRYVTRHTEKGELAGALSVLADLGRRRPYDHRPLLALLRRDDVSIHHKYDVLHRITELADHLDEQVLLDLLDDLPDDLSLSAACKGVASLSSVRNRAKAARLLRRCLKTADTTDDETFQCILDAVVNGINGNEDIFEAVLQETQTPHEIVLLAVSLMKETLPPFSRHRTMAEQAAAKSQLAEDYYHYYVGLYVAKDDD